jgi:hypothetical protein
MSAQIIPFPRVRPLAEHELPDHWPSDLQRDYLYRVERRPGDHARQFAYCEARAAITRHPNESDQDFLLREARLAFSFMRQKI